MPFGNTTFAGKYFAAAAAALRLVRSKLGGGGGGFPPTPVMEALDHLRRASLSDLEDEEVALLMLAGYL